jgi:hypothetical protein
MSTERRYIPAIGSRVNLRMLSDWQAVTGDYSSHVMIARELLPDGAVRCELQSTANGVRDGEMLNVPLNRISAPIGWKPRYTIHAAPDKVADVLAWLARGITVRFSRYIGDGSTAFQPADNAGVPHWRFGEVTDTIASEDTRELIRVVKMETVTDAFLPAPCRYCNGSGTHTTNPSLEEQTKDTQTCERCGRHLGFSFTEPWHSHVLPGSIHPEAYCNEKRKPGECWVCNGSGLGARYLSEMEPRKERKYAIRKLETDGWKIWYEKRGRVWFMERETVVKNWGFDATEVN